MEWRKLQSVIRCVRMSISTLTSSFRFVEWHLAILFGRFKRESSSLEVVTSDPCIATTNEKSVSKIEKQMAMYWWCGSTQLIRMDWFSDWNATFEYYNYLLIVSWGTVSVNIRTVTCLQNYYAHCLPGSEMCLQHSPLNVSFYCQIIASQFRS